MPHYEAIAHVMWELPFPLRLPPAAFFCWEPDEGLALFDPRPEVGELGWRRKSCLLQASEVFSNVGFPNQCYPDHDYLVTDTTSGKELKTAHLTRGPEGGFCEPRPYTVANVFLCLSKKEEYAQKKVVERAGVALNNIIDVYRFVTMDPLARSVRADQDCYYTLVSMAELPNNLGDIEPRDALTMIGDISFGRVIGTNRAHHIGLNSFDDLLSGSVIPKNTLDLVCSLVGQPHELELFHQLMLSAIRRLKRREHALAVLDAQSAFETFIAVLIAEHLSTEKKSPAEIESEMGPGGILHSLQRRLQKLDALAAAQALPGVPPQTFLGSTNEQRWRNELYGIRNKIVHEGVRTATFGEAKAGLVAGLHAIEFIQSMTPAFGRAMMWPKGVLDLAHLEQSSGRISRLFEV